MASCLEKKEISITGEPSNLSAARKFVADNAGGCGFSEQEIYDIKLAVGEALANAIEHGSPEGVNNNIIISCSCDKVDFQVSISDQGNFKKILPGAKKREDNYRGRGVLLMLALMDRVVIDETEQGTRVNLTKRYTGKACTCD